MEAMGWLLSGQSVRLILSGPNTNYQLVAGAMYNRFLCNAGKRHAQ